MTQDRSRDGEPDGAGFMAEQATIDNLFVCIGAQKAGTTWLARALAMHPEIFVTPVKEIHYFDHVRGITRHLSDKKRRSRYRKFHQKLWTQLHRFADTRAQWPWYREYMRNPIDDAWYADLFRDRAGKRFAGEATPEYAIIGRDGYAHMQRLAPDVRILFIMRNPVTRAWSQVLHHCRSNRINTTACTPQELIALVDSERFNALGNYLGTLRNLDATFTDEQQTSAFYEDIHDDRLTALEKICGFIGIGFEATWFPRITCRHNRSQNVELPGPIRAHLRQKYRPLAEQVSERAGRLPESWAREFDL